MKNGEKQYSLRGLNSVLFGFLLIMLTGIIGSAAKGILALNVTDPKYAVYTNIGITAIGGLLSWILIIAGLSAVKDVSHKFRNARKYYIIKFVGNFAGIGLIALTAYLVAGTVAGGLSTGSVDDAFNLGTKAMAIIGVTVVVALIIWIVSLLAIKNLLGGVFLRILGHDRGGGRRPGVCGRALGTAAERKKVDYATLTFLFDKVKLVNIQF